MLDDTDLGRRHFLVAATVTTGAAGMVAAGVPFVASFKPSARAQALGAPVEVDIGKLEPGALVKVEWRGRVIMIVRRTESMLGKLADLEWQLADPASSASLQPSYAVNAYRSIRPEFLVVEGVCTHLGCAPTPRFDAAPADLGSDWAGGFFCACHGSKFDLAGRVYRGVPAPTNLSVPPHRYVAEDMLLIGSDMGAS